MFPTILESLFPKSHQLLACVMRATCTVLLPEQRFLQAAVCAVTGNTSREGLM